MNARAPLRPEVAKADPIYTASLPRIIGRRR
jgi:hypothetical protein